VIDLGFWWLYWFLDPFTILWFAFSVLCELVQIGLLLELLDRLPKRRREQ
jgi:hypothetical protein